MGVSPGGDPETLGDGDEIVMTQSAIVLEQLIGKFMFGNAKDLASGKPAEAAAPTETKEVP